MARRYVTVDRQTPMLLPTDMREWVGAQDSVHLVIEAVEQMDLSRFGNHRGTGSEQYPPAMMLALLIYCYGQGIFSSRKIEAQTYRDVAVRYITADTHPDHDTIAAFRRNNAQLVEQAFVELLHLAKAMGVPKLGTVVLDGTKLRANASARHNKSEAQLSEELAALAREVQQRLALAEQADTEEGPVDELPQELADPKTRRAKLEAAREALKRRVAEQTRPSKGKEVGNTTDPDSRVQFTSQGYIQGYNAQLAVSAESGLIVAAHVCKENTDRHQLAPTVEAIPSAAGTPHSVVADTGYDDHEQVRTVEKKHHAVVFVPPHLPIEARTRQSRTRAEVTAERHARHQRVMSESGRAMMKLRRCVVEPVFGTLKAGWRFLRFQVRGLSRVNTEWMLLCAAYNARKLNTWRFAAA